MVAEATAAATVRLRTLNNIPYSPSWWSFWHANPSTYNVRVRTGIWRNFQADGSTRRGFLASAAGSALAVVLASCGGTDSASEEAAKEQRGYISGDGTVRSIKPSARKEPVTLSGQTLKNATFNISELAGKVVVVNLWVSWCGPCHAEADDLVSTFNHYRKINKVVEFIGINYRESSLETGIAQAKDWKLPYDSIFDAEGKTAIQMQGVLAAQPSTAVLDREGRVAAVVLGAITKSTLQALIDEVVLEA